MTLILSLRTDAEQRMTATLDDILLAGPTPLAQLPRLAPAPAKAGDPPRLSALQQDPFTQGQPLYQALGGDRLREALNADIQGVLLLDADDPAAALPWEFTSLPDGTLLAAEYGLLRLVTPDRVEAPAAVGPWQIIALGADPLVGTDGTVRTGYRLRLEEEVYTLRRVLQRQPVALHAQRIPPTRAALQAALQRGPAILHLSAHGSLMTTQSGVEAVLALEDETGRQVNLLGSQLRTLAPRGVLRLVVLSACRTDDAARGNAGLAQALVRHGLPAAIGMQGDFPDALSDDLVEALYGSLLAGHDLAEALRQVRLKLASHPYAAGLPVSYTSRNGWQALPRQEGMAQVAALGPLSAVRWPEGLSYIELLGRNADLHALAARFGPDRRVVTVVGTGGIGKTALAAGFVQRFGWRWPDGVLAVSFANAPVSRERVLRELLAAGTQEASLAELEAALLRRVQTGQLLLLLDNYESVLDGCRHDAPDALAVQQLAARLAEAGASLLLTSREHPAGLRGEQVYPSIYASLPGLAMDAGAALFLQHSTRASAGQATDLASQASLAVEGHAQALILLAGEYDASPERSAHEFLAHWPQELAAAARAGLPPHQRTLAAVFERSYAGLSAAQQTRMRQLSLFDVPALAEGVAAAWGEELSAVHAVLGVLVQRHLLEPIYWPATEDTPAGYRFQPVVRQEAERRLTPEERTQAAGQVAAYGAWLAEVAYGAIHQHVPLAQLTALSFGPLEAARAQLSGIERLWHVRRLAFLRRHYGDTTAAQALLEEALAECAALSPTPAVQAVDSGLRYEMAQVWVTRGELDRALALYEQSLALLEQIGDIQGKAASLHQMAQVWVTRGELDRALALYEQSLALDEQIGDIKGKAASLSMMANVWMARGQWQDAERALRQALGLAQAFGDPAAVAFNTVKLGQVAQAAGRQDEARQAYQAGLAVFERLGMPEAAQVRGFLTNLEQAATASDLALDELPPAAREQALALLRQLEELSSEEMEALLADALRQQVADQVRADAVTARRGTDAARGALAAQLSDAAHYYAEGEEPGSPFAQLAEYMAAVAALLRGDPLPPIPALYADHLAAIQQAA